jgi:hypothetical protein
VAERSHETTLHASAEFVAATSNCPHADEIISSVDAVGETALTAPAMAIAVAAPPTPPKPPKPRESSPSTTKTNATVLHACASSVATGRTRTTREVEVVAGPRAHSRIGQKRGRRDLAQDSKWVPETCQDRSYVRECRKCERWRCRQAYRAHTVQGQLADCADCAGSPNGADPRALRAHRLAASTELALTKLHYGPPGPVRRPRARVRGAFEQLQAVLAQEACDDL